VTFLMTMQAGIFGNDWRPVYLAGGVVPIMVAFGVGSMVTVAQAALYAFAPLCYSASIRNTGVRAAIAAGRLKTIAGPLLAGSLLGAGRTAASESKNLS
jgi:MFS transporter, AAHS family, 3-hydroxyphenylpropionic acid transporter